MQTAADGPLIVQGILDRLCNDIITFLWALSKHLGITYGEVNMYYVGIVGYCLLSLFVFNLIAIRKPKLGRRYKLLASINMVLCLIMFLPMPILFILYMLKR